MLLDFYFNPKINFQSVEKILFARIWQGSNMGFALWAKSVYSKNQYLSEWIESMIESDVEKMYIERSNEKIVKQLNGYDG